MGTWIETHIILKSLLVDFYIHHRLIECMVWNRLRNEWYLLRTLSRDCKMDRKLGARGGGWRELWNKLIITLYLKGHKVRSVTWKGRKRTLRWFQLVSTSKLFLLRPSYAFSICSPLERLLLGWALEHDDLTTSWRRSSMSSVKVSCSLGLFNR